MHLESFTGCFSDYWCPLRGCLTAMEQNVCVMWVFAVSGSVSFSDYSAPVWKLLHVTLDKMGNDYSSFIEVPIFYFHWILF